MNWNILPECHADTLLIDLIGFKKPNHQPNIGDVINTMKSRFANKLAIGFIDDDKTKPKYVEEFEEDQSENNLKLLKHRDRKHYLIIVQPAFEEWVFSAAENLDINPSKYKIRNLKYFKKIAKNMHVHKNENVKQLLNAIKQTKNSPMNTFQSG